MSKFLLKSRTILFDESATDEKVIPYTVPVYTRGVSEWFRIWKPPPPVLFGIWDVERE